MRSRDRHGWHSGPATAEQGDRAQHGGELGVGGRIARLHLVEQVRSRVAANATRRPPAASRGAPPTASHGRAQRICEKLSFRVRYDVEDRLVKAELDL